MDIRKAQAAIEAILFASGEPVELDRLAQAISMDRPTVQKLVGQLTERVEAENGGLSLVRLGDCYQLTTKPEYADAVRSALDIRRNVPLSQAALEVLAVVAYNQPVTKGYIEQVRGVDCSGILSNLVAKKLVGEAGRLEVPGRPILYETTADFLRCFGFHSLEDLPRAEDLPRIDEAETAVAAQGRTD